MPYPDKPLYDLLPPSWDPDGVLKALVAPSDDKIKSIADTLETFHRYVNPATCPDPALDWLADFYGFPFWAARWTNGQKRALLTAIKPLRRLRGTLTSLTTALSALGLSHKVYRLGGSYLPLTFPSPLTSGTERLFIRLPREYPYLGPQWQDSQSAVNALMPAGTEVLVCHEHFYLSVSALGNPLFQGEEYFDWQRMPFMPPASRSKVATACINAAVDQAYSAKDLYALVSSANYYFGYDEGSLFTTVGTSSPATQGQAVGAARGWIRGDLVQQSSVGNRPTMSAKGLTFTNSQWLEATFAMTDNNAFTTFVVTRPLTNQPGAFLKVGDTSPGGGWGIGVGSGTMDNPGLSLLGLHEWVNWIGTSSTLSTTSPSVLVARRASGTTELYLGSTLAATETSSINAPTSNTYINGLSPRRTNSEMSAIVSFNRALSPTEREMMIRYLNTVYL